MLRSKRSSQSNKRLNHRDVLTGEKRGQEGCGPEGEGKAGREGSNDEASLFPWKTSFWFLLTKFSFASWSRQSSWEHFIREDGIYWVHVIQIFFPFLSPQKSSGKFQNWRPGVTSVFPAPLKEFLKVAAKSPVPVVGLS